MSSVEEETKEFSFDPIEVEEITIEDSAAAAAESDNEEDDNSNDFIISTDSNNRVPREYTINANINASLEDMAAAAAAVSHDKPSLFDTDEINKKLKEKNIKYNFNELMDNFFDNFMNKKTSDDDFLKNIMYLKDKNDIEGLRNLFSKGGESVYNNNLTESAVADAGLDVDMNVD